MKKQLLLIAILLLAVAYHSQAQDEKDEKDRKQERKENYGTHNHFSIDLGINNYLENGNFPDDNNAAYSVKPFGSWNIALKSINDTHVGGPLHVLWGLDVSWYNFKFENEAVRLGKVADQVTFGEATDIESLKSKLTATYLDFSLVPMLKFGDHPHHHHHHWMSWDDWDSWHEKDGFRIGAGGYAGYKIASYAKYVTKENGDKHKDRDKDGFYLNNFRYGVRVQAGFRGLDMFVNYDVSELFVEGKGPQLNAFSFGVVL